MTFFSKTIKNEKAKKMKGVWDSVHIREQRKITYGGGVVVAVVLF